MMFWGIAYWRTVRIVKTFLYFLGGKFQENEYESRSLNVVEEHEVHDRTRSSYHRKFSSPTLFGSQCDFILQYFGFQFVIYIIVTASCGGVKWPKCVK